MYSLKLKWDSRYWIALAVLVFMAIAFLIRMIPALFIRDTGFLYTLDSDTWYTLRQVEVMVNHFPRYDWFDPMTAFPTGKILDWGPFFPFITAVFCLVTGATTHREIIFASGLVSPVMAALMVPVTYFLGKTIWDRRAGIIAATLISVVSLIYFSLTTYGLAIHHIGELLFSSLFFLAYGYYLTSEKCLSPDIKNIKSMFVPVTLATLAGVLYFLALITSTTTLLALIVVAVFTFVQSVIDQLSGRASDRLLVLNLVFLSVSGVLLVLFGFKQPGYSVTSYTIGLVYVNLALIAETFLLFCISKLSRGNTLRYVVSLLALALAGFVLTGIYPPFEMLSLQAQNLLFGSSNFTNGVVNTAHLSLSLAWEYFSVALILAAAGFVILVYRIVKTRNPAWIFLLVWSVLMILITIQFQRFAYFSTVNIVLLSAICIAEPFGWKRTDGTAISIRSTGIRIFPHKGKSDENGENTPDKSPRSKKPDKSGRTKKPARNKENGTDELKELCLCAVIILGIALFVVSLYHDADLGLNNPHREISPDWVETSNWLGNNTPLTGIDYFGQYDASTFSYPSGAYGILARWDAGHWITFFSHRIPITNPFQDHLEGSSGAYAFYLSGNESAADGILEGLGGRYVIVDSDLTVNNFASLAQWVDKTPDVSQYVTQFFVPSVNDPSRLSTAHAYNDAYFRTMIVRLYSFDGSMAVPGPVHYIQYDVREVPAAGGDSENGFARIVTLEKSINGSQVSGDTPIIPEGPVPSSGKFANVFSDMPDAPVGNIPALQHFRLVHESPDSAIVIMFPESTPATDPDKKQVKVFEYVNGARIPGNGIIEVPLVTNTGRAFVYRQESAGGEFIVPYATEGTTSEVRATGPYHIVGTTRYINVTEADVRNGTIPAGSD